MRAIRIALSGSGFKFPAHVGALHAIRDAGFVPVDYAGTSGGSIVAALAASGFDLDNMKELTLNRDWSEMLSWSPLSLVTKMGYCDGKKLEQFVHDYTLRKTFSNLGQIGLTIVATDMAGDGHFVFSRETTPEVPLSIACKASAAIPFVYQPVQYKEHFLCDGGVANNIPVDLLPVDGVTPIIGIHLTSSMQPLGPGIYGAHTFLPRLLEILMDSAEEAHAAVAAGKGALLASIDTSYCSGLDRNLSKKVRQRLFDDAYASTSVILAKL